jgi:hypothetical protein
MRYLLHLTVLAVLAASPVSSAMALEATAGSSSVQQTTMGIENKINDLMAARTAAINRILRCNNKKMAYVSNSKVAGRDANGCVKIASLAELPEMTVKNEARTKALASIRMDSYPDLSRNSKGYSGTSTTKTLSLKSIIDEGATDITLYFTRAAFRSCNGGRQISIKVAADSSGSDECRYDSNPNRYHHLSWGYVASSKALWFNNYCGQCKSDPNGSGTALTSVSAAYNVVRVVKVGK